MIARRAGWGLIYAIVGVIAVLVSACHSRTRPDPGLRARQWQVTELTFAALREYRDPFDFETKRFWGVFTGPEGRELVVPGFWDGGTTWRIRFTPTTPGRWVYATHFTEETESGLHGKVGALDVDEPTTETALRRHGGFLAVSDNRRYLTYTDGTPFFWLGDTWWRVPSSFVPFEHFKTMVDTRVEQGFTVFQALGHVGFEPPASVSVFDAVRSAAPSSLLLWRITDLYLRYAEAKGLVGVIGFAGRQVIDQLDLADLRRLWWYYIARYGAFPITFLITQEYNAVVGENASRVSKVLALGRFIHEIDPYHRAMTVHPWVAKRDQREAWPEAWHGFAMLQGGHFSRPDCESYLRAYATSPRKPILEAELNYEGFSRGDFRIDDTEIRRSAYVAIQCGSFGFSYGAQGLYAGVQSERLPGPAAKWGPVITWQAGLALPGGVQMRHLRTFYESVSWWRLAPWGKADVLGEGLVKSAKDELVTIYVPRCRGARNTVVLRRLPADAKYDLQWFDPRSGVFRESQKLVTPSDGMLRVPDPPTSDDWLAVLKLGG